MVAVAEELAANAVTVTEPDAGKVTTWLTVPPAPVVTVAVVITPLVFTNRFTDPPLALSYWSVAETTTDWVDDASPDAGAVTATLARAPAVPLTK
jgi:hypothetical protein